MIGLNSDRRGEQRTDFLRATRSDSATDPAMIRAVL